MQKILSAWLRKNQLTEDPNSFVASVAINGSVDIAAIVDKMQEEGMEIKRETVLDIISRFNRHAADMVLSGYNVNTGLVYLRPVVKGIFKDKSWSPITNPVYIATNQGLYLRNAAAETVVEILGEQADPLEILSLTDKTTGKTDGTLTPGRNAELKGSYLKIIGDNPHCGIIFKNISTQAIIKLDMSDIVINEPSRLLIFVPATLDVGEYELTLSTQYSGGGKSLIQPRKAIFNMPIVII